MKLILGTLLIIAGLALFQNCSDFGAGFSGNGNGYGGYKIDPTEGTVGSTLPVNEPPAAGTGTGAGAAPAPTPAQQTKFVSTQATACADGSLVRSRILLAGGVYSMLRHNCTDLPSPFALDPAGFVVSGSGARETIFTDGQVFTPEATQP